MGLWHLNCKYLPVVISVYPSGLGGPLQMQKAKWLAVVGMAFAIAVLVPAAHADSITTLNYSASNGSGPFGTVDLHQVNSTTVQVTLTLTAGEVFAITGAGDGALGFSVNEAYPLLASPALTTGFTLSAHPRSYGFASGIGNYTSAIVCSSCGHRTSPPEHSGPVRFDITNASGFLTFNFAAGSGAYLFASDIGKPKGDGDGFNPFVVGGGPTVTTT